MITVGIVDDKAGLRRGFERLFNSVPGFRCLFTCASGEEALNVVGKQVPDVILMDIEMQGMSGIECTLQLKKQLPQVRIIMVTVCDDDVRVFQALRSGAIGYLLKSASSEEMIEAVKDAVKGGAPMSRDIALKVVETFHQSPVVPSNDVKLSPRENELLDLISSGYSNKEIADSMTLSLDTIRSYLKSVYDKLHVHCRTDAVLKHLARKPSV